MTSRSKKFLILIEMNPELTKNIGLLSLEKKDSV